MVMSRSVYITTLFLGRLRHKQLLNQYVVHILSPVTDKWPIWISGRERMAVEMISWPISMKEYCRTGELNLQPPEYQSDMHPTKLLVLVLKRTAGSKMVCGFGRNRSTTKLLRPILYMKNIYHKARLWKLTDNQLSITSSLSDELMKPRYDTPPTFMTLSRHLPVSTYSATRCSFRLSMVIPLLFISDWSIFFSFK